MLAQKLKEYRKQNNLTQQELADKIYVSRSAVAKWEQGRGIPGKDILTNLCYLLNCTKEDLLSEDEAVTIIENVEKSSKIKVVVLSIISVVVFIGIIISTAFCIDIHINGKIIGKYVSPDSQIVLTVYDKPQSSRTDIGYTIKISGKYKGTWGKEDCQFIGLYWSNDSRYVIQEFYYNKTKLKYLECTDFQGNDGGNLTFILDNKIKAYYSISDEEISKLEYEFIRWDETSAIMLFNFDLVYGSTYISGYFWSSPFMLDPAQGLVEIKRIENSI